ncbi:MAG: hypothetical protein WC492_05145 [Candidatus Micrarchaeia archaeon]
MAKYNQNAPKLNDIVQVRIDTLLSCAHKAYAQRPADSKRYVELACTLAKRHRIAIGSKRKKLFCTKCFLPMILQKTMRIENEGEWEVQTCILCGKKKRFHCSKARTTPD